MHLWLTTEKIIEMFLQANPRKLQLKRFGEYVDGVKLYLQISEEISFISENMIFNDAVIIDLVSYDGVK